MSKRNSYKRICVFVQKLKSTKLFHFESITQMITSWFFLSFSSTLKRFKNHDRELRFELAMYFFVLFCSRKFSSFNEIHAKTLLKILKNSISITWSIAQHFIAQQIYRRFESHETSIFWKKNNVMSKSTWNRKNRDNYEIIKWFNVATNVWIARKSWKHICNMRSWM